MDFDIKDYLERQACKKIVSKSKYESPDPELIVWWNKLFKDLEDKCVLPNYKKRKVLQETYSFDTYEELEELDLEIHDELEGIFIEKSKSGIIDNRRQKELDNLGYIEPVNIKQKEKTDPFMNFMRKSKKDAQIWRPQKKASLEELSLMEKAENVTENIAVNFDEWFKSMGGQKTSEIDKDIILELFKIQFDYPAATSLNKKQKEIPSMPTKVADGINKPELSESNQIKKEIRRDVKRVKKAPPMVAFGKTLPLQLRVNRDAQDVASKWLNCYVYHDELTSMETCFKDIVELQSTRSFCKWLLDRPEIQPAKFLLDQGLTDPKVLERRIFSAYQILDGEDIDLEYRAEQSELEIKRPSKVALPADMFKKMQEGLHSSDANIVAD